MTRIFFRLLSACCVLMLVACATAPTTRYSRSDPDQRLTVVAKERHRLIEQYVDGAAIAGVVRFALPTVEIAANAASPGISATQAALVANNAGRAMCNRLASHVELVDAPGGEAASAHLTITAIVPTGRAAAGASSVLGIFIPVPFRLPAGLGALAGEAELRGADQSQLAAMHWARGANSVMNSAKLSTIGDAWQLARQFGDQFARAILDTNGKRAGVQHVLADASVRATNRSLCAQRFGTVNLAGRGASLLLPLSPESIDPGAPTPTSPDPNLP